MIGLAWEEISYFELSKSYTINVALFSRAQPMITPLRSKLFVVKKVAKWADLTSSCN